MRSVELDRPPHGVVFFNVTKQMREAWDQMDYFEKWADPAYRLMRVEEGFNRVNGYFVHGSCSCPDASGDCDYCQNTSEFSSSSCEVCGTPLAGHRYNLVLIADIIDDQFDYHVCADCYYYCEYGQLDDRTMLEIEDLYGVFFGIA